MREQYALIVSSVLAAVFSCAFLFLTVEIPYRLNFLLRDYFPDLAFQFELIEKFLAQVRPIGYLCFMVVISLTVVGLAFGSKASSMGALALFLPTFGYFAYSMFFLAGLGILRVIWAPLWDVSPDLLKLGDVVYHPCRVFIQSLRTGCSSSTLISVHSVGTLNILHGCVHVDIWEDEGKGNY